MKEVIAGCIVLFLSAAATARGQSVATSSTLCTEAVPAPGTYTTCALWMDGHGVRKGTDGALIAAPSFFRPIALTRFVTGDSAKAYSSTFDRRSRQAWYLSIAGAALTTAGVLVATSRHCQPGVSGGCIDDNRLVMGGGLVLAGSAVFLVTIPIQLSATRAGAKSIWWNNARFAR